MSDNIRSSSSASPASDLPRRYYWSPMKAAKKVATPEASPLSQQQAKYVMPVWQKVALVALCSVAISSTGLIMRTAEHNDSIAFSPMAATFFSEVIKLAVSIVLTLGAGVVRIMTSGGVSGGGGLLAGFKGVNCRALLLFLAPAVLYVAANNLRFYIAAAMNPGLLQVLWNLKIVTIGALYNLPPFSRRLSGRQWCGAGLLALGSTIAELSQGRGHSSDGGLNSGGSAGLLLVAVGLVITSFAAISCEYAYKHTAAHLDFFAQCCVLYGYGSVLNLAAFVVREQLEKRKGSQFRNDGIDGDGADDFIPVTFPKSLTVGFDAWAWLMVASLSVTGFLVGMIFKYIDSVAQVYSDMSAMFVTAAVAWMVFGLQINIAYILALLICTFSLLVYYGIVCVSWDTKAVDDSGESEEADDEEDGRGITLVPLLGGEGGGEDDGDGDGDGDEGEDDDIYDLPEASLDDSELGLDEEGQGF